jgi:Glycosyl hydrolase family 12
MSRVVVAAACAAFSALLVGGCAVARAIAVEAEGQAADAGGAPPPSDAASDAGAADAAASPDAPSLSCSADAAFATSSPSGEWTNAGDGLFVLNNVWDLDAGPGPQTLCAYSYKSWYVVSEQTSDAGLVESYPNVQMNFDPAVAMGSLTTVTSTFAEVGPGAGAVYEYAFDVWLDGVGPPHPEILVWVDNEGRVPAGTQVATAVSLDGRTYDVWKTADNSSIELVSTTSFASGSVDLLQVFQWVMGQAWGVTSTTTIGQIDFGVEIESTGDGSATFQLTDFSLVAM